MRTVKSMIMVAGLVTSVGVQAAIQWSGCETIIGVNNYQAYNNSVILALSPALSGCSPYGVTGGVAFTVGTYGVSATNIDSFLASSLAAFSAGSRVMVFYDDTSSTCTGLIVANGGQLGQCP